MAKVQSLEFDDQRPVVHLRVYVPNVFADDAHEQKLKRSQEKHSDGDRGDAHRELTPEQQFVGKVDHTAEHGKQRSGKTRKCHNAQWYFRQLRNPKHRQIVKRIKIVLGLAALAALLFVLNLGVRQADFGDHSTKVRIWIAKLAHKIDNLPVIQAEAGEVFVSLDAIRHPVDQTIEQFPN